jgi:hypothetical protein
LYAIPTLHLASFITIELIKVTAAPELFFNLNLNILVEILINAIYSFVVPLSIANNPLPSDNLVKLISHKTVPSVCPIKLLIPVLANYISITCYTCCSCRNVGGWV